MNGLVKFTGSGDDYNGRNAWSNEDIHYTSPITDHTLCGLTMDGDSATCGDFEIVTGRITCSQCLEIIRHCKQYK